MGLLGKVGGERSGLGGSFTDDGIEPSLGITRAHIRDLIS